MIRQLRIKNIILIEDATIDLTEGLNVLTGETGSGKSAIMAALDLVLGARADSSMVRRGTHKAVIEALFDVEDASKILPPLEEAGIDHDDEQLIIRREIYATGKSRAFINNQMAHLVLLKTVGKQLVDLVGQHANRRLLELDFHREFLDSWSELSEAKNRFYEAWQQEKVLKKDLEELITNEAQRLRDIEICRMELEELDTANIHEGEEESLFEEYSLLTNSQELIEGSTAAAETFSGVIAALTEKKSFLEKLCIMDGNLEETTQSLKTTIVELQEVDYSLRQYASRFDLNPSRLDNVSERLTTINRLKRKFGPSVADLLSYQQHTHHRLESLTHADDKIDILKEKLQQSQEASDSFAKDLHQQRSDSAKELQKLVQENLQSLNMPSVQCEIRVTKTIRSQSGDDQVTIFLAPNVGEKVIPLHQCASGGELSRVMLTIKALLAGKERTSTLIFDEVDANIGGETADVIGARLASIGKKHQVLCITHFPQVARHANHHLLIKKQEQQGRTHTSIQPLNEKLKNLEMLRMSGKALQEAPLSL